LKDRRRRTEGGEWEPIKITHSNLAYISNFKIRHAISPEKNGQVNSDKFSALVKSDEFSTLVKSDKTDKFPALVKSDEFSALVKSDKTDKFSALVKSDEFSALVKSTRKTVYLLSGISPNTWLACSGNYAGERFRPQILETCDPVAQEQLPASPATIHTKTNNKNSCLD
jgi:hypothetical protein